MTISYSDHFWRLLCRWKGSLWRTIWRDLTVYLIFYYIVRMIYRYAMTDDQQKTFEKMIPTFNKFTENIPLTFMLGFYVGMVVKRWWDQFQRVSWPDNFLYWVSAYIKGVDSETTMIRRTIARYCLLSSILGWRSLSGRVLKRFPTLKHIVKLGLMTDEELDLYQRVKVQFDPHRQWFVPLSWVQSTLVKCYEDNRVCHVNELAQLISELQRYRTGFIELFIYDWITIPLVYTQVAIVVTYGYFVLCLIGRQFIDPEKNVPDYEVDMYVPIFTILQFLFYVGWLKVGEDLMNPFGEDDEDFELNYLIDRNWEMAFLITDTLHGQQPQLTDDWAKFGLGTNGCIAPLPHTNASIRIVDEPPTSHLTGISLSQHAMEIIPVVNVNGSLREVSQPASDRFYLAVRQVMNERGRQRRRRAPLANPNFV